MKKIVSALLVALVLGPSVAGLVHAEQQGDVGTAPKVLELFFTEQERGVDPYPMRMLVSEDYLRFDDGVDQGDFLLLRRSDGAVFNVVHSDKSVLEIPRMPVSGVAPGQGKVTETRKEMSDAPVVGGQTALEYEQTVENESCVKAVVIPGLFPDAVAALQEFHLTMAGQQQSTLKNMPEDMRTLCLVNRLVYSRAPYLQDGFPMSVTDQQGHRRQFLEHRRREDVSGGLFHVPENYDRIRIGDAPPLSGDQLSI